MLVGEQAMEQSSRPVGGRPERCIDTEIEVHSVVDRAALLLRPAQHPILPPGLALSENFDGAANSNDLCFRNTAKDSKAAVTQRVLVWKRPVRDGIDPAATEGGDRFVHCDDEARPEVCVILCEMAWPDRRCKTVRLYVQEWFRGERLERLCQARLPR